MVVKIISSQHCFHRLLTSCLGGSVFFKGSLLRGQYVSTNIRATGGSCQEIFATFVRYFSQDVRMLFANRIFERNNLFKYNYLPGISCVHIKPRLPVRNSGGQLEMKGAVGPQPQKLVGWKAKPAWCSDNVLKPAENSCRRRKNGKLLRSNNCGIYLRVHVNGIVKIASQSPRTAVQSSPVSSARSVGN